MGKLPRASCSTSRKVVRFCLVCILTQKLFSDSAVKSPFSLADAFSVASRNHPAQQRSSTRWLDNGRHGATASLFCSASFLSNTSYLPSHLRLSKTKLREGERAGNLGDFDNSMSDGSLATNRFDELYFDVLPAWLLQRCMDCGWTNPTQIQKKVLDTIFIDQKESLVVQAETGSGKTLSFLLPCFAAIDPSRSAVQALVVVPTRELGLQVARVAKRLAAGSASSVSRSNSDDPDDGASTEKKKIMVMSVLQGSQNKRQRAWAWAEPPHVIIGTPQELCNMVRLGGIKRYNSVKFVVVDEVDACLLNNAGSYTPQLASSTLHELLSKYLSPTYEDGNSIDPNSDSAIQKLQKAAAASHSGLSSRPLSRMRRTIFCSATIPQHRHFLKQCVQNQWTLQEPVHVALRPGEQHVPRTLRHGFVVCATPDKKLAALRRLILKIMQQQPTTTTNKKVLIFVDSHRPLEEMAVALASSVPGGRGIYWKEKYGLAEEQNAEALFAVLRFEDNLSQRAAAIDSFRRGQTEEVGPAPNREDGPSLRVLLSTDLAARGLDIADVTHIIQFDLPPDADTYVHRAGRAGRMGRSGHVVSIISPEQEFVLTRLANKLGIEVNCIARQETKAKDIMSQ